MTRHKTPRSPSAASPPYDTKDRDLTGHVRQFAQNFSAMARGCQLEQLDLRTQEGALDAIRLLDKTLEGLKAQRRVAAALATLLAEAGREVRGSEEEASCRPAASEGEEELDH